MGKLSGNWITGAHSGRACRHDDIYTKVNKKTGACYSVKICNPNTDWSEDQLAQRSSFGAISSAIAQWIKTNKVSGAANNADYLKVKKMFDRQSKYSTLRGMMYARGMYVVSQTDGSVTVDITAHTVRATAGGNTLTTKYTLSLSASPANGGTVSGAGQYSAGASATITATAHSGYTFTRWSDGSTSASRTIVMDDNKTLSATFTAVSSGDTNPPASGDIVITAQAQPAAGGTVSGSGSYASGASVTLTAVPNSGYQFLRWNDGDTNAEKTVTVTEAKTYNAIFSTI